MNNGLLYFGAFLVVVFSALFAVPNLVDWNGYRGVFEEEASKVLGRDVRVGGEVNLKFLPAPYVRFEKVRIANVSGRTGESFIRAESFTMWLSGSALLRGVLEASKIELEKPALTLAAEAGGGGNWTNFELKPGELPFVPRDVALRSVQISDGSVSIYNAATERVAEIEKINGELSADSIRGPFRFKGSVSWSKTAHSVNFATDPAAGDGSIGIKAFARSEGSGNAYLLEGRASDFGSSPTFKGTWTGTLAVPGVEGLASATNGELPLIDVKAEVTADVRGTKLDDLVLSLANAAQPQMITGSAVATWATPAKLDVTLNSKWLDIDWLSGASQGGPSFAKLRKLALGLMESVAGDSKARAKIDLDRVKLGGESAGGLRIDAERDGAVTRISRFNVSLPGGTRFDLSGEMKNEKGKRSFSGDMFIGGSSLGRLHGWAAKLGSEIDVTADGAYSLTGKLDIDPVRFALSDAFGSIAGRSMSGDLTIAYQHNKRVDLVLQAEDLDASEIFPGMLAGLKTEFRKALGLTHSGDPAKTAALPGDMRLRVIAGRLTDGNNQYCDVDVTFEIEGKTVRLPTAKATTANGLIVRLEGKIKTGDGASVGRVAYDIAASSPDAMKELVQKAGLTEVIGADAIRGLKSGKLAGVIELGRRAQGAADVSADGVLNGSSFQGSGEFDGGFADWRTRPSRIRLMLDAPSLVDVFSIMGRGQRTVGTTMAAPAGRASASLIMGGTVASGLATRFDVSAPGFAIEADGTTVWPEGAAYAFSGQGGIKANDFADILTFAGLSLPAGTAATETRGRFDVERSKGVWRMATRDLTLGTAAVSGDVQISMGTDGRRRIDGKVGADRVRVATLLTAVTGVPPTADAETKGDTATPPATEVWPAGLFDFAALDMTDADVRVSFASLDLSGNVATRDGELRLRLSPGKITISDIAAEAAGGKLTGSVDLEKVSNGVTLASQLVLEEASLVSLSDAGEGTATVRLDGAARAQSPAGLMAVFTGAGHVTLKGATLRGPSAEVLSGVVENVMHGKAQNDTRTISTALLTALSTSQLSLGDREFALTVTDGQVSVDPLKVEGPEGQVEATVSADLTSFKVSAACQVTPIANPLPEPPIKLRNWKAPPASAPLPPALVLYDGQLDDLSIIKSSVDVNNLQRELAVRQVERNVQLLELSRRVDEERARLDRQRRTEVEAQRASAVAAERDRNETEQLPPINLESAHSENNATSQSAPSANGNTVSSPTITVEPIAPTAGEAAQDHSAVQGEASVPDAAVPAVVRPASRPAPRPQRQRRTSSDEVMRSLGNFP